MTRIPEEVAAAWEQRQGPAVFATAGGDNVPNAIYVTCVRKFDDETFLVADNYFHKTRANLKNGSRGSLLFITEENKAYQVKGDLSYEETGVYHAYMRDCLDRKFPVVGVAVLAVEEVYHGAEKLG